MNKNINNKNKYNLPNKLISLFTVALLSSGFLTACMEEQDVNYQNRMSDGTVLQDGTTTTTQENEEVVNEYPYTNSNQNTQNDNYTFGNNQSTEQAVPERRESDTIIYPQENVPNAGVPGDMDLKTYPNQNNTYNNPNSNNSDVKATNPDINNYPYNSQPTVNKPQVGQQQNPPYINGYPQGVPNNTQAQPQVQTDNRVVYENEEQAKNDYLLKKNQELIEELRNEIKSLHKKIDYISARVGQNEQQVNIPGLEGLNSGSSKVNRAKELAEAKQRAALIQQKLSKLEMDQKSNFSTTKQEIGLEKSKFTIKVGKELSAIQEKINSDKSNSTQKQRLEKIYQLTNENLNKLKFITPGQNWDTIKNQTISYIRAVNPAFNG